MTYEEINGRSHKVLATVSVIDALNYSQDDLEDLTKYLADRCGFTLHSDMMDYDKVDHARRTDTSLLKGKTHQEILEKGVQELKSIEAVPMSLPPVDAYNIVAVVQAAIVCLDLPEHTEKSAKQFVYGFCDRYRDQMPTIVQCINSGWDASYQVTKDEFEESLGKKWEAIARDIEDEMQGEVRIVLDHLDKDYIAGFFGLGEDDLEDIEDDRDPSEKPCPCGQGTTTLRDCDGRPCAFYAVGKALIDD